MPRLRPRSMADERPASWCRRAGHSREEIVARSLSGQAAAGVAEALAVSIRGCRTWLSRCRAGALIHPDLGKPGCLDQPGHGVTGTRPGCRNRGRGRDLVDVAADDTPRLSEVEGVADARKTTATGFPLRTLRRFPAQGIRTERMMTGTACASRPSSSLKPWHAMKASRLCNGWLTSRHVTAPRPLPVSLTRPSHASVP